jgi:hypothetical protein
MTRRFAASAAILLTLGVVPRPASTQQARSLAGVVVDTRGDAGIGEAQVEVIGENAAVVASTRTDSLGRFSLAAPPSGVSLAVRRMGFAPWTATLASVSKDTIVIRLERVATLEAMQIHAPTPEERHLEQVGFFDRMKGRRNDVASLIVNELHWPVTKLPIRFHSARSAEMGSTRVARRAGR